MPQDTLHHYLVLDLLKQLISQPRVENLFDSHISPVESALVDGGETTLTNLLSEFQVTQSDLSNTRNCGQASCLSTDVGSGGSELSVIRLLYLVSQGLYLVEQLLLFSALVLQFLLYFPYFGILSTGRDRSLISLHVGLAVDVVVALAEATHPIAIIVSHLFHASQSSFVLVARLSQVI